MNSEEHWRWAQLSEMDTRDPVWTSTQWTAWQRKHAVEGYLLIAVSCGLLAGSLAQWGRLPLAATTIAPLAMTLLCLGVALVDAAFGYRYRHASNGVGRRSNQAVIMTRVIALEVGVALVMLFVQVAGALLGSWIRLSLWEGFSPYGYALPVMVGMVAFAGMWAITGLAWNPTRAPDRTESVLTAQPQGAHLFQRWLALLVVSRGGVLIVIPAFILFEGADMLEHGITKPFIPQGTITGLTIVVAFFLLATVSELALWTREPTRAGP